jgi:sec-independent protein translocase protein TatC
MAATSSLRSLGHEERLTLTGHLTELRARLMVCALALAVLFAGCLWQSRPLLDVLNRPLSTVSRAGSGPAGSADSPAVRSALARSGQAFEQLSRSTTLSAADRRVAGAAALLLGLPLLLWQAWGFLAPAVAPAERRAVRPLLALAPLLFVAGVAFAYLMVLPPAVRFLQGFNHGAFDALVQARDYYHFELVTMLALGAIFQIPVVMLVLGRAGLLSSSTLRAKRRYAIVALAILAALLPGTDPVTTVLEMIPLVALYELSIVLLRTSERRHLA